MLLRSRQGPTIAPLLLSGNVDPIYHVEGVQLHLNLTD